MTGEYKVSYTELPTNGPVNQSIILIENGGKYGFASCPGHNGEYWCADEVQIKQMEKDFSERNVKPLAISSGEEKTLVDRIVSR